MANRTNTKSIGRSGRGSKPKKTARRTKAEHPRTERISSKLIYKGPVFSVYSDRVREGHYTGQRDVIRHPGSIVILAVDEPSSAPRILLCRQYRHAAGKYMWELPAGRIDRGEKSLAAAKRELLEETGYSARRWQRAFRFYSSPGFLDETMDIYLARDLRPGAAHPEEDEQIAIRFVTLREALRRVMSNQIDDAKTMTAVLWLERTLHRSR